MNEGKITILLMVWSNIVITADLLVTIVKEHKKNRSEKSKPKDKKER